MGEITRNEINTHNQMRHKSKLRRKIEQHRNKRIKNLALDSEGYIKRKKQQHSAFELGKSATMWLDLLAMSGCSYAGALGRSCEPFGVNDFAPDIPWPCGPC